jgi:Tetracyclin repressor-like, C-terminal domain
MVIGATARELTEAETRRRTDMTEDEWRQLVGPYVQKIVHSGHYPHLARVIREADDRDYEQRFEFGLACVLRSPAPIRPARIVGQTSVEGHCTEPTGDTDQSPAAKVWTATLCSALAGTNDAFRWR